MRGHDRTRTRIRPTVWAAWAGILGPVLFTVGYTAQEIARADTFDPVALPVSALSIGPWGWVQQVNFALFGILTFVFAAGLHRGPSATLGGAVGPALLAVSGVGLLVAGAFSLRVDAAGAVYDPGGHRVGAVLFFLVGALGLMVLSARLRRDPRWRSIAGYTLVAGAVAATAFVAMAVFALPEQAPLHAWTGLLQRVLLLLVLFPCRIVLAVRLLRTSAPAEAAAVGR
jgi:hypothetical membrane protein